MRALKVVLILMCIIIILLIATIIYLFYINRTAILPKEESEIYQLKEYPYKGNSVFALIPKEEIKNDFIIFYIHGGAYVTELHDEHWQLLEDLVKDLGCVIIAPDYPLTPKYQYTDIFNMLIPLYEDVQNYIGDKELIVIGESSGGGMGLAMCQKIGEKGGEQPDKLILLSPWLDVTMENPQIQEVQKVDPVLNQYILKAAGIAYAGENGMDDYLVNPILGPLDKLKNVVIFTGTKDILNPDVHVLEEKAKQQGITLDIRETKDAVHVWMLNRHKKNDKVKSYMAEEAYQELVKEIER